MARDWEADFKVWSVGPGKTEEAKMVRAEETIRATIDESAKLGTYDIEVLATGSYKNRTHIPSESDVDVAVIYKDVFFNYWRFVDPRAAPRDGRAEDVVGPRDGHRRLGARRCLPGFRVLGLDLEEKVSARLRTWSRTPTTETMGTSSYIDIVW